MDPSAFGTHSGRRGGATRAANADIPDRLFKEHGAWRSERVKDAYVVSSLQSRLSITANLGLQPSVLLDELVQFERAARLGYPRALPLILLAVCVTRRHALPIVFSQRVTCICSACVLRRRES
jgi:hypothetical protein